MLRLAGIHKRFGALEVVRDVDLGVARGELVAILGPSGCGKSTLLRIAAGLDRDFSGTATFDGVPIRGPGPERGLVFQEHRLLPWLTVAANVALPLTGAPDPERVAAALRLVGLDGFERAYPHQLSGGMAQRAGLARALVNRPRLMLLDEPFAALDWMTRVRLQDELGTLNDSAKIIVTHDLEEAVFLGDRVLVLSGRPGRVRAVVPVSLPRPRDRASPAFAAARAQLYHACFSREDEVPASPARPACGDEGESPLPRVVSRRG
jgi:sulfonate transport system ATP-binding protein